MEGTGTTMIPAKQIEKKNVAFPYFLGRMMWRMPLRFDMAKSLGFRYSLRCLLFHDIADEPSEFTNGLNLTLSRKEFENGIRFLSKHYTPVGLSDVLGGSQGRKYTRPPVLVTFDDAYASVARDAMPILQRYRVPAIVFVNASTVGNQDMLLDNLICYVANTSGLELICSAARDVVHCEDLALNSLGQVFSEFLPALPQTAVQEFRASLASAAGINTSDLARQARINVSNDELRSLVSSGFEIGNHTYSHVFCRSLQGNDFDREIVANKTKLESMTGTPVRAFSVPYGASVDLTGELLTQLRRSGHEATFLVESCANTPDTDVQRLNRVSIHAKTNPDFFAEVEILPRLRSIRNLLIARDAREVIGAHDRTNSSTERESTAAVRFGLDREQP
jgi:peptidoglycan/xylan/chitin deacetylase (PgdA/CDA1 family)